MLELHQIAKWRRQKLCSPRQKRRFQQLNTILEAQLNRLDVLMGAQPGTYAAELSAPKDIPAGARRRQESRYCRFAPAPARYHRRREKTRSKQCAHWSGNCRVLPENLAIGFARQRSRNSGEPVSRGWFSAGRRLPDFAGVYSTSAASMRR